MEYLKTKDLLLILDTCGELLGRGISSLCPSLFLLPFPTEHKGERERHIILSLAHGDSYPGRSWENRSLLDGQVSYPLGKDAAGYIMYNEDGYMFVAIMGSLTARSLPPETFSAPPKRRKRRPRKPTSPIAGAMNSAQTK